MAGRFHKLGALLTAEKIARAALALTYFTSSVSSTIAITLLLGGKGHGFIYSRSSNHDSSAALFMLSQFPANKVNQKHLFFELSCEKQILLRKLFFWFCLQVTQLRVSELFRSLTKIFVLFV